MPKGTSSSLLVDGNTTTCAMPSDSTFDVSYIRRNVNKNITVPGNKFSIESQGVVVRFENAASCTDELVTYDIETPPGGVTPPFCDAQRRCGVVWDRLNEFGQCYYNCECFSFPCVVNVFIPSNNSGRKICELEFP